MIKQRITMLAVFLIAARLCASDVELRVYWAATAVRENVGGGGRPQAVTVVAQLLNSGQKEVVVLCKKKVPALEVQRDLSGRSTATILYRLFFEKGIASDQVVIPSESELLPVRLRPAEMTQMVIEVVIPENVSLTNVNFEYSVNQKLAERFGAWGGVLRVPVKFQR